MEIVSHRSLRRHVRTVVPINRPPVAGKPSFPLVTFFLARDGEPGYVYQVKGDVEAMRYQPSNGPVNLMTSHSFHTIYHIAELTESQAAITKEVCDHEIPPSAPNRRLVTENCQSWVVRVVSKLVKFGIEKEEKLEMARQLQDPIEKQ